MQRAFILLLTLLVLSAYSSALNNNFVLDDETLITRNPRIEGGCRLLTIFTSSIYDFPKTYRPLQVLSYELDYKLWGLNPAGFHLTSIFLHILNSFLLYLFFRAISTAAIARAVSVLFAVHPVNTSVVAYISGRADILAVLFILLSILFFQKFNLSGAKKNYAVSLLCAAAALLCRESALILPLFIFLVIFIGPGSLANFRHSLAFIALDLAYIVFRLGIFGSQGFYLPDSGLALSSLNFFYVALKYLSILIFPLGLHMFRAAPFIYGFSDARVIFTLVSLSLLFYIFFRLRKNKLVIFGAFWFFCGLSPVFLLLGSYPWLKKAMMAESWLYLPGAGAFLLFAIIKERLKIAGRVLFFGLVIILAYLTYQANAYWKDNAAIYENTLKYHPQKNPVRAKLINEYLSLRMYNKAFSALEEFARDYPEASLRHVLEGDYYYGVGDFAQARASYARALRIGGDGPEIREKLIRAGKRINAK